MTKRTCTIDGCTKPHRAKGYCGSHYNQHYPSPNRHAKKPAPCAYCGTDVLTGGGGGRKYGATCSEACKVNLRVPPRSELPADHWARWYGKTSAWPHYGWRECAYCNDRFAAISTSSKHCSSACSWRWNDRANGVRAEADILAEVRQCVRCGDPYQHRRTTRTHCSDLCRELDRKDRGVTLYRGWISDAERIALYERDNYTCWLCNKVCDPTVDQQKHADAPTLDHVQPRSKGGTHEHGNLRTACRHCNSIRSDSGAMSLEELGTSTCG